MVRGRRARTIADTTASASAAISRMTNGNTTHLVDDQYCASPKRKDCKIDDVANNLKAAVQAMNGYHQTLTTNNSKCAASTTSNAANTNEISKYKIFGGAKTRSQTAIKQYFHETKTPTMQNYDEEINDDKDLNDYGRAECNIKIELNAQSNDETNSGSIIDLSEDTCDGLPCCIISSVKQQHATSPANNIFLQTPVLSLNVDKSPNQASSIKINKTLEVDPIFPNSNGYHQFNGQFNKIVTLRSASLESNTAIVLNTDSNSCDSGVVVDKQISNGTISASITGELSPSRRRKPTTPHRILCPSPVKHATVEKSLANFVKFTNGHHPSFDNRHGCLPVANGHTKHSKTRRRLNPNQSENYSSMISPQIIGGVTLIDDSIKTVNFNENHQKTVLNSSVEQDKKTNNVKVTQIKNRVDQNQPRERNLKNHNAYNINRPQQHLAPVNNKKVTDFFPVRRSVRKTKKAVQEEMMRSIEKAIVEGHEEGLRVENFEGKGRGIIAERDFKRGEFVVEYIGELITIAEANDRESKYSLDENAGCYMYYFKHRNQQYCIDATQETGKLGRLVNHSRNGNLLTKVVVVKNHPHLVLIAKDDIQSGEELTYDYGDRSREALMHHPWLAF